MKTPQERAKYHSLRAYTDYFIFQVIASVLRNLSWRADVNSKKTLREVGSVRALMGCALEVQKVTSCLQVFIQFH